MGSSPRRRVLLGVTVAALLFQLFHLAEHSAQMIQWALHPQRGAWMSTWGTDIALGLGRVGNPSEVTTQTQQGVELLHFVGNLVFMIGAVGLVYFTRNLPRAQSWARATLVVQGLHLLEHVMLTVSLFVTGTAVGVSTGFGLLNGTQLSTYRVLWHGLVNLVATASAGVAVLLWRRAVAGRPSTERLSTSPLVPALLALALLVPFVVAIAQGRPVPAGATGALDARAAPVDLLRSGDTSFATLTLVDVAAEVGLDVQHSAFQWDVTMDPVAMMGGGVCWIDVDNDGWLDLFLTDTWANGEWGLWDATDQLPTTRIFRNFGGAFEEYTEQWNAGFEARANGCVAADLNGDGYTDLYVTTSRANLLLWNEGGEGFVEGAAEAGVDAYGWNTGVAAGDLNGDGLTDLVVAGYTNLDQRRPAASTGFPNTFEPISDLVFVNRGSVSGRPLFASVGEEVGIEPAGYEYGLGVTLVDVDQDGDLDLQVANDTQPNRLYLNEPRSDGVAGFWFRDAGGAAGVDDPNSGMGIASGDVNGDEIPDFVVTNLEGQGHAGLVSGRGEALSYVNGMDAVSDLGLTQTGWGASFGDLDLDGNLDILVASGQIPMETLSSSGESVAYLAGLGDASFVDNSQAIGLGQLAERNGRGVALADYDNDGDLDAVVSAIGQPLALLQNRGAEGHWLIVDSGVPEPGMQVRVALGDGRVLQRAATAGGSWLSSEDPRVHFGLGSNEQVERVEVTRADGRVEVYDDVPVDEVLRLKKSVPKK